MYKLKLSITKVFYLKSIEFNSKHAFRKMRDTINAMMRLKRCSTRGTLYKYTKYGTRSRGWIKLHAVIDINNFEIIDYSITDEHANDAREGIKIVRRIKNKIRKLYGDRGYDSKLIYNELDGRAVIPPRGNASTQSRGSPCRAKITRFIKRFSERTWKVNNNYGFRWNVEIYFSGIKRMFGESVRAVKPENIVQEMMLKVYFYNEYSKLREGN